MNNHAKTDDQLLQQFRQGDDQAFGEIVCRYQDRVFRLAAVWLHDYQLAEDVAQEVFLRGHKGLRSFLFRATVYTWLYRTTRNVCFETNRRHKFHPLDAEQVDDNADPGMSASNDQTAARVRELVSQLPGRQREVVVLRIFEGMSVRDTAFVMACREGTVKALLHKATSALRIHLDQKGADL